MRLAVAAIISLLGALFVASPLHAVSSEGNINVSGTIPTPPPSTAPTIDRPVTGKVFDQKNITVSGKCIAGLIVKLFSNNVFVGSTICQSNGSYQLRIDLFVNRNDLVARQYDSLNQASPDSNTVSVYYLPAEQQPQLPGTGESSTPPTVAHFQLIIDYDYTVQSIFATQPFRLPIKFMGGSGPYVVTVDWGDGSTNSFRRDNTQPFDIDYTYLHPGTYTITLGVTDSRGQQAHLQFVIIVQGEPDRVATTHIFGYKLSSDVTLLVLFLFVVVALAAFAAGRAVVRKKSSSRKKRM